MRCPGVCHIERRRIDGYIVRSLRQHEKRGQFFPVPNTSGTFIEQNQELANGAQCHASHTLGCPGTLPGFQSFPRQRNHVVRIAHVSNAFGQPKPLGHGGGRNVNESVEVQIQAVVGGCRRKVKSKHRLAVGPGRRHQSRPRRDKTFRRIGLECEPPLEAWCKPRRCHRSMSSCCRSRASSQRYVPAHSAIALVTSEGLAATEA